MEDVIERKPLMRENYRENLGQVFSNYLKDKVEGEPARILSVGCGFGFEAEPLLRVFPKANYTGIDIDGETVGGAIETNEDLTRAEFQTGDARTLKAFGNESWDIIVLRHPQVLGDFENGNSVMKDWRMILQNSMAALKQGGVLFVSTTDEDYEGDKVLDYIRHYKEKMTVVVNDRNKFASGNWPFKDNFIIVAKKMGQ